MHIFMAYSHIKLYIIKAKVTPLVREHGHCVMDSFRQLQNLNDDLSVTNWVRIFLLVTTLSDTVHATRMQMMEDAFESIRLSDQWSPLVGQNNHESPRQGNLWKTALKSASYQLEDCYTAQCSGKGISSPYEVWQAVYDLKEIGCFPQSQVVKGNNMKDWLDPDVTLMQSWASPSHQILKQQN